jgi:hypothetical protein
MRLKLYRCFALLLPAAALLFAQSEMATLLGIVTDTGGTPVANATLAVIDADTGVTMRQVPTAKDGTYEIPYLKPGTYRLTINEDRFESFVMEGIRLEIGKSQRVDVKLKALAPRPNPDEPAPPPTPEAAPVGQPRRETVSNPVDYKTKWLDTPLVEFHPSILPLLTTAPAVEGDTLAFPAQSQIAPPPPQPNTPYVQINPSLIVISGISNRNQQTYDLDGVAQDSTPPIPGPASLDTVEVSIANPSVESSRPVNFIMVTRRGSQAFHGWGYYKLESSKWDAQPFFDPSPVSYRAKEEGGNMTGPIIPGTTYFSGGIEYQKTPYDENLFANVPTAQMRSGDLSQFLNSATAPNGTIVVIKDPRTGLPFPNNQITGGRITGVSSKYLSYYPPPTLGDANTFVNNYSWLQPDASSIYNGSWPFARIDQRMWHGNQAFFEWMQNDTATLAPGNIGEQFNSTQSPRFRTWVVSDVQAFSPELVNHFKLSQTGTRITQGESEAKLATPGTGDSFDGTIGLEGVNPYAYSAQGFPALSITGLTSLGMAYGGGYASDVAETDKVTTVEDSVTWSRGRHSIKAGAQYFRMGWLEDTIPQCVYGAFSFTGQFTGSAYADFLLGLPATSTRCDVKIGRQIRENQTGAFVADSFRVSSRLTLNYGVRWDYYQAPVYVDGYMANWNPQKDVVYVAPGTITSVSPYFTNTIKVAVGPVVPKAKTTNYRPRVGAAYQLANNLVLRGGFGEYTENEGLGPHSSELNPTNPWDLTETYNNTISHGLVALTFPNPFPASPSPLMASQSVTALPSTYDEGVIKQYNGTIERTTRGLVTSVSYIGSRGTGLNYTLNVDKPRASTTPFTVSRLPYPEYAAAYETRTDGQWHYDSVVAAARRRAGPVLLDTSFTWANNDSNYANTTDPYNVTDHWTRDAEDRRLYFVASAMWTLPFGKGHRFLNQGGAVMDRIANGWTLAAMGTIASGQYYSPFFTGPDPANASPGFVTQLPDCVGNPNTGAKTINQWFNPSAFAVPSTNAGRYGSCGMNILEGYPIHVAHASLAKRVLLTDRFSAVFSAQVSNITNTPHFSFPNNNISTPSPGMFMPSSLMDPGSPEKQGYRQIDLKLRVDF